MPRRNRTPTDEITLHYWNLRRQVLLAGRYAWEITLDEYLALWLPHWAQRKGATRGASLVVARTGATGPYRLDNVRIDTRSNQVREMHAAYRDRMETLHRERHAAQERLEAERRADAATLATDYAAQHPDADWRR